MREMYERLVQQWDRGKLTPAAAKAGLELVKLRATLVQAEDTERRLAALEEKLGRGPGGGGDLTEADFLEMARVHFRAIQQAPRHPSA